MNYESARERSTQEQEGLGLIKEKLGVSADPITFPISNKLWLPKGGPQERIPGRAMNVTKKRSSKAPSLGVDSDTIAIRAQTVRACKNHHPRKEKLEQLSSKLPASVGAERLEFRAENTYTSTLRLDREGCRLLPTIGCLKISCKRAMRNLETELKNPHPRKALVSTPTPFLPGISSRALSSIFCSLRSRSRFFLAPGL
jgi:hypothetical protein